MLEVIQSSTTTTAQLYPEVEQAGVPSSATVVAYSPTGETLATITATIDSVSTTVSTASADQQTLTLASASGVSSNRFYLLTSAAGAVSVVESETLTGTTLQIAEPAGFDATGATLKGIRVSATLPAEATADRGVNYSLIWTVTQAEETRVYSEVFHVVRTQFKDPVSASDVYAFVSNHHPSLASSITMQRRRQIAQRANARVRARLLESQRYAHLVGDSATFKEAGRASLEWVLLSERMLQPATDDDLHTVMSELDRRVSEETSRGIANCWYDENDDRKVDRGELAPVSIRIKL